MSDHLLVAAPGLSATLQDAGRQGYQRFGISGSGAMDPGALALANALVGNPAGLAGIEATLTGPSLVCEAEACRVALAGADMPLDLNGQAVDGHTAHDLRRGDRLRLGTARSGLRAYLAVAGGFAVAPMLGSLATHTRSRLGGLDGGPLAAGSRLPLRDPAPAGPCLALPPQRRPDAGDGPIRVVLGPQDDHFTQAGRATFLGSTYALSARSDRMGSQLDGPAIEHAGGFNIVSDGIVNGSIQVPGHGRPIVLLADRQTTGGYPKIATVISADLGRLAQMRPGAAIRFAAVSVAEAQAIARAAARDLAARIAALRPAPPARPALTPEFLLGCNLIDGVASATAPLTPGDCR